MPKKIIVADDHPLFRDAIMHLLQRSFAELQAIQVDSLARLCDELKAHPLPALVLLDLKLSDTRGMDSLLRLKKQFPPLPVLVVSAYDDDAVIRMAMEYGASGFLPKRLGMDSVAGAIRQVLDGDTWFPDIDQAPGNHRRSGFEALTTVQIKVLTLLREGKPSKEIASILCVTESTIKAHLTEIFRKLGVRNRTQAVVAAREIDLSDNPFNSTS